MSLENIYSVGIDIGTTTTQVIFSRLVLEKSGGSSSIPDVKITKKDIIYRSEIHFTPLLSPEIVDAVRLKEIVAEEYRKSAINIKDITTGAVIITGESARKENARDVSEQLAEFAGDFVVCTAGPDYEAVLAGWGSGAGEISKNLNGSIINFDIGGGTTNAAVFKNGEVTDAFALDIGGRLVRVSPEGVTTYVSEKIKPLIKSLGLKKVKTGQDADIVELGILTARMAEMFLELAGEREISGETKSLFIGHSAAGLKIDHIMFSGGVAECIYEEEDAGFLEGLQKYGDIGPLLGLSIRRLLPEMTAGLLNPHEKIRATVVGAGSYSMGISGSTVAVDDAVLPLKNIPVIKFACLNGAESLGERIAAQVRLYDGEQIAIAINGLENPGYEMIKRISEEILTGLKGTANIIIVIVECDCAKAIGLLLRNSSAVNRPIICLDKIHADNGDFIDIGKPISGVVPVIVKTLIFGS